VNDDEEPVYCLSYGEPVDVLKRIFIISMAVVIPVGLTFSCLSHISRASVKLLELGVRTPGGLFLGVRYAGGVDFRRFRTPSLAILGVIFGLLKKTNM